ncbi:MAG: transglutaminase domain-containing protein [Tepidisphaeraceae bacterium]
MICELVALGEVNPDRVYLIGYSAGGDGVYQLAPRMADRWAAVGMMAGHPNETVPIGLRNIGFALHVGANDNGYGRNTVAAQWKQLLADAHRTDPAGYKNQIQLHNGRSHWMNHEETSALPFMQGFTRDPLPAKVVWKQDDVTHDRLYWLAVPKGTAKTGSLIIARRAGQTIDIDTAVNVPVVTILLNDDMLDLDQPVIVRMAGVERFNGVVPRSKQIIRETLAERGDRKLAFCALIDLPIAPPASPIDVKPWSNDIPEELVQAYILPNTNVDETSEDWRAVLTPIAREITKDAPSMSDAALALNRDLFKRVNVQYHPTKRPKPNQSPSESMSAGFASCSGLSILLVDACRSVGIPARLVGTPAWANKQGDANGNHAGNHTWVEVWDGSCWRFLGASEVSAFDQTWFNANASLADSSTFSHGIYAVGGRRDSALHFPMVWNADNQSVPGIDVSDYYAHRTQVTFLLPDGASMLIRDNGQIVGFTRGGTTTLPLAGGRLYTADITHVGGTTETANFTLTLQPMQRVSFTK